MRNNRDNRHLSTEELTARLDAASAACDVLERALGGSEAAARLVCREVAAMHGDDYNAHVIAHYLRRYQAASLAWDAAKWDLDRRCEEIDL